MTVAKILISILALIAVAGCSGKSSDVPAAGAEAPAPGVPSAAITAEAAQKAGIEVAEAGPAQILETLTLYGSIKPNAEREQDIRARYPGVVHGVDKRAGDAVAKGTELLTIESNESLQVYSIRAPLSGRVLERRANVGDAVDGSTVLMKVADLSTVWAEFAIFARDLNHVRPGMRVFFRGADADESGEAKISYVAPAGHADSQSVVARATVENKDGRWVPGQFITGDVVVADLNAPVAVKPSALQEINGKTVVFVQAGSGFEPKPVEVGKRARDAVEIVVGLAAGDRYAAANSYLIKADLLKGEAEED
jgi:cobalt-zinc-cadmium efflux system membrane fusion protein